MRNSILSVVMSLILLSISAHGENIKTEKHPVSDNVQIIQSWLNSNYGQNAMAGQVPNLKEQECSEREFVLKLADGATGSGNGGNPLSLRFERLANIGFNSCRLSRNVASKLFSEMSKISLKPISFKLCAQNDLSDCDLDSTVVAKSYAEQRWTLINIDQFNSLPKFEQITKAVQQYMEIISANEAIDSENSEWKNCLQLFKSAQN
ncbi:MAG: hypothetical protein ACXVCY_11380 [Pseudobdellovibrionaceae bacterium]